jgi:S-methylmethionine-dependent homocysteine/selenocysteine methylase
MEDSVNVISSARLLPHQTNRWFLTDGGIETSLVFDDGIELPHFAAFDLLRRADGRAALERYYARYLAIAANGRFGFVLESPTWRSNPDWAARLGYSAAALTAANVDAIELMHGLRAVHERPKTPIVISGCVGPRGDGYVAGEQMAVEEAQAYHTPQVRAMAGAGCDVVTATTMTNVPEAIGIVRAVQRQGVPSVVSFTVETDGRLPSGATLEAAIAEVDGATGRGPAYYMINCAHPTHFERVLDAGAAWTRRLGGLRANASCKSHVELNEAPEVDRGNPIALAGEYGAILERLPQLRVFGGCCGTDHQHVGAIAAMLQARKSVQA